MVRTCLVASTLVCCFGFGMSAVRAAIIVETATINGSAAAGGAYEVSVPPPVTMSFGAEHRYETYASGLSSASANTTARLHGGGLSTTAFSQLDRFGSNTPFASASVTGTIVFHETTGQTVSGFLNWQPSSRGGSGGATLESSSHEIVMNFRAGPEGLFTPASASAFIPPGAYTLTWDIRTQSVLGLGGQSNMAFSFGAVMPEPACLALLALPAMMLARRRSRAG
jgi:hypothetical protein